MAAEVMIAVNPCKEVGIYTEKIMNMYLTNGNDLPPHIFSIGMVWFGYFQYMIIHKYIVILVYQYIIVHLSTGRKLIESCVNKNKSKTVLLTGVSGAGKSENAKQILNYICYHMPSNNWMTRLKSLNPLLELFGNAETAQNHNSTRFNKFIQVC